MFKKLIICACALVPLLAGCGKEAVVIEQPVVRDPKPTLNPFTIGTEVFNPEGSHIQGIAACEKGLFLSQKEHLYLVKWDGTLLRTRDVVNHTGDICWYDGELYTAVAVSEGDDSNTPGKGKIQVFDETLKLVREVDIDRRCDGITCMDGIIYIGMGSRDLPSKNPHRVNILGRFDAKTLKEIAERAEFDYGYETKYGFQDISNDGTNVFASFYGVTGAPCTVSFDKNLKVVKTYNVDANNGLDMMPKTFTSGRTIFIKSQSIVNSNPSSVSCNLTYWNPAI